jgi:predicted membrane-bound spermidine synthase
VHSPLLVFLMTILFMVSLSVLLLELTLTRLFSIILWYDYAFMVISIAFFGLGIGSLLVHILKGKLNEVNLPSRVLQSTMGFAISLPIVLLVMGQLIPSNPSFIYVFYLSSSIPFFFAGLSVAMIYLSMPKEITRLYFIDLIGAGAAALILDPIIQVLGAESVLLSISLLVLGPTLVAALFLVRNSEGYIKKATDKENGVSVPIENKLKIYGIMVFGSAAILLVINIDFNVFAIEPGISKGLYYQLAKPQEYQHLSTQWNSFSRIDVTKQTHHNYNNEAAFQNTSSENTGRSKALASIIIDADADTPVFRWNGSFSDISWVKQYMDYLPYELLKANSTLVIGSGGGEDILIALAGGSKNVTAVEINPLIISKAKEFGKLAGNLYDRKEVDVYIDDGRRFISSSNSKYDIITIKLVDSWAAQLAGGYALSENYLYTVEAFRQYLQHLDEDNGMLVMVRWNIELPRLMPLIVESLRQETGKNAEEISRHVAIVEDRPGLYFGANENRTIYPVLVMLKNKPFTSSEISIINERARENNAELFVLPGVYAQPPYDELLTVNSQFEPNKQQQGFIGRNIETEKVNSIIELKPPTDDSPFFFAREKVPEQMILLLVTVLSVSAVLALLLIYYSKINNIHLSSSSISWLFILFAIFIGLGFMVIEITFIQKFLLLLGTPIMALTVILFSILVSSGVGAYLSGKLFGKNPHKGMIVSIPLLVTIIIIYYIFLQEIINHNIASEIHYRIGLTFALLSPAGVLMGFQFPSVVRISSLFAQKDSQHLGTDNRQGDVTLLWGVNVIASVIGTVLTAILSMIIGFSGSLLVGAALYSGAMISIIVSLRLAGTKLNKEIIK